jgi:hypothetical protein
MGRFRIYASKNNTILEDSETNTGLNEVSELWYGDSGISRLLMKYDIDSYMNRYFDGDVPSLLSADTSLVLYSPIPIYSADSFQATSFDVECYLMEQSWDEGIGHDFIGFDTDDGYSNWYSASSLVAWDNTGATDQNILLVNQHFDNGDEPFSATISSNVSALWAQFTGQNYGVIYKYTDETEADSSESKKIKEFFTRHTHTYYKPYMQIDWDNRIEYDENNFIVGQNNRLFTIFSNSGRLTDPYSVINLKLDYTDVFNQITSHTLTGIVKQQTGVYYVDYDFSDCDFDSDISLTWRVQYYDNYAYRDVVKTGRTAALGEIWETDESVIDINKYVFSIPNLKDKYYVGEVDYLEVLIRKSWEFDSYSNAKNLEYSIHLVDGNDEFIMEDWCGVSYYNDQNFIKLDTYWYIPKQKYRIKFRLLNDSSQRISLYEKDFWVVK